MYRLLLGSLVILVVVTSLRKSKVSGSTSHVCSRTYYVTNFNKVLKYGWDYKTYYTSCGFLWLRRCARTVSTRRRYYVKETYSSWRTEYYCCSGWRTTNSLYGKCSSPICRNGCARGRCISPNTCACDSGWTGSRCNKDVNECTSSTDGCQQRCINTVGSYQCYCLRGYNKSPNNAKSCQDSNECTKHTSPCSCAASSKVCTATCTNSPGSYRCSCSNGFKLISSSNICRDVNECAGYKNKCGRNRHCINTIGSYRCDCQNGYKEVLNRPLCEDINECNTTNGECEHICINTPGSRRCACRRGYLLDSNGRLCSDIDECREGGHGCQYRCRNTRGSFTCYCGPGYELNSDKRTCSDINECRRYKGRYVPLATCQQVCTNTDGSYDCGCRRGFEIRRNRRSCKDIDECKTRAHRCGQICINTIGSYSCSCTAGYELHSDGRSCRALSCEVVTAPLYSSLICSGTTTGEFCWISCYPGYEREGLPRVICMPNQKWSVPQPTCRPKSCGILSPRANAIVSLPCYKYFGSTCDMRCKSGYYSSGSSKASCALTANRQNVEWKSDFKCFHVRNCKPNPCRHGGTCISLSPEDFQCDCTSTGYEGRLCEQGVIHMPLFPKLKKNEESPYLSLQATPSKEIKVLIRSDDVVAYPNVIEITRSNTNSYFTLIPQRPGFTVISYYIQGENEDDYKKPADSILFVSPEPKTHSKSIVDENPTFKDDLIAGCYMTVLDQTRCSSKLSSTLPWNRFSNQQFSTQGIVHLETKGGRSMPLSLVGFDFPFSSHSILNKIRQFHQLNYNAKLHTSAANNCKGTNMGSPEIIELVENDVFATTFFKVFSTFTPSWMTFSNKDKISVFDIKNIHALVRSESDACSSLLNSSSVFTYEPNAGSILTLEEDITLPDERGFCYAIDACTSDAGFTLSSGSTKAIKSSALFQNMRNAGWDIGVTGVIFPGNGKAIVTIGEKLWNGRKIENFKSHEYEVELKGTMKTKIWNRQNISMSLDYQGDIFIHTDNLEESFRYGLEREITSILKGKSTMNLTTTVLGKQVTIHLPKRRIAGKFVMGGVNKGLFIVWKRVSNLLQGTSFSHVLQPKRNHDVFVVLEHQIRGGRQRGIANSKEYDIRITLIRLLMPQLKNLLKTPKLLVLLKAETLDKWSAEIHSAETLSRDIRSALSGDLSTTSSLSKFSSLITKLRKQMRNIKVICQIIESEAKKRSSREEGKIVTKAKNIKNDIPKIPSIRWRRSSVTESLRNFKLLFDGKMCSNSTCFDDIQIILETNSPNNINVAHQKEIYNPSFVVRGKFTQRMSLGSVAALEKEDHVLLEISNGMNASRLFFNLTINLLGMRKQVTAMVKHDVLSFQTSGLMFGKHQVSINVSAKKEYSDWSLIQHRLQGIMNLNGRLPRIIQKKINTYAREVAEKAIVRIKNAKSKAKEVNDKLQNFNELLRRKTIIYEELKQKKEMQRADLNANRIRYKNLKVRINSSLREDDKDRARYRSCQLMACGKICSMMKVCGYERKEHEVTNYVPNCHARESTVERENVVQKSEKSFYLEPTFVSLYTGSCGTGGFFGSIKHFFTGCSRTYEMVRGQDKRIPYTKVWLAREREKIPIKVFNCSTMMKKAILVNKFEFSCSKTKCIKVMNSTCIQKKLESCNQYNPYNPYIKFSAKNLSQYEKFKARQFENLTRLTTLLDTIAIELETTKVKLEKAKRELNVTRTQKAQLENAKNELDLAVTEIKRIPDVVLGLKLSRMFEKHRDKNIVDVGEFTFDMIITSQTKLKKQIQMTIAVNTVDGKKKDFQVLFDFDKDEISTHSLVKQVIRDLYKKRDTARTRRSIPNSFLNKFLTTPGNQTDLINVWKNHRRCLKTRNAKLFYTDVVKSLEQLVHIRKQAEQSNKDNVNKLVSLYKTFEEISTAEGKGKENNNSRNVLKHYLEYFTLLINEKQNFTKSWEEVVVIWKAFLEGLTKERSFSECAGFQDCVVSIADDLNDLYLFESDFFRANEIRENVSYVKDSIVDLISKDFTLKEFKTKVLDLKSHLRHTEDTNVLCGRKPNITLVSGRPDVVVENETLVLYCNATSDTKVTYQWIHNNESVIQSDDGSLLIRKVNTSHAGFYKCRATNRKGSVISNVTMISVKSKPKISEHPSDTKVYAKDGKGLLLVCNATGDPVPYIQWFFISQYPNSSEVKIFNDNGTFLFYEKPTANYSGYYYCIARNIYGRAESRKARIWVLDISPGQPRIEVKMNISKACNKQTSLLNTSKSCGENTSTSNVLDHIHRTLVALLNCSLSQIENLSFSSNGYGNFTVRFLYISLKPIIDEVEPVFETVLDAFASKRQQLVEDLRQLYETMKNKTGISDGEDIMDPESLFVRGAPPGCSKRQQPHSNGYLCVNCPPGSYRNSNGRCMLCPLQTYQYKQGQTDCIPCEDGLLTKTPGTTSPFECFKIRHAPPNHLEVRALGSSKLHVKWLKPDDVSEFVRYYLIEYSQPSREGKVANVSKDTVAWTLTGLKAFTNYHISVYAVYSDGKKMAKIKAMTEEDVPDAVPVITQCIPLSHDRARITWLPIPKIKQNGIIRGYKIYFKAGIGGKWQKWQERTINSASFNSYVVAGLKSSTWYCFKMSGFTSKGQYKLWKETNCWLIKTPFSPGSKD